jgi:hypothetical protein
MISATAKKNEKKSPILNVQQTNLPRKIFAVALKKNQKLDGMRTSFLCSVPLLPMPQWVEIISVSFCICVFTIFTLNIHK